MKVLAFDPGPTKTGWAFVDFETTTPKYLNGGYVESLYPALKLILTISKPELVIIEKPAGFAYEAIRVAGLIDTAFIAGFIWSAASELELDVVNITARDWRKVVIGKANASDAEIKVFVEKTIGGLPSKSNVHIRDALGAAVGGYRMNGGAV